MTFTSRPPPSSSQADKTAPSLLPISPALYSHDTSSSFVIRLSLPNSISFLTATRAVIYMQILQWLGKNKNSSKHFLQSFTLCSKLGSTDWTWPPEVTYLPRSRVKADGRIANVQQRREWSKCCKYTDSLKFRLHWQQFMWMSHHAPIPITSHCFVSTKLKSDTTGFMAAE